MKITFFGTSSGTARKNRRNTSIFFEIGNHKYIFDMGCNVVEDLHNRDLHCEQIDAIFISHMHGDHVNGLIPFLGNIDRPSRLGADPLICLPPPMEQTIKAIDAWRDCTAHREHRTYRYQEIGEGTFYDDGTLKVTAYRTAHCWMSFSFLLEAEGKRVYFSGDFSREPENEFPYEILEQPLDAAICELGHFSAEKYQIIFAEKQPKKMYITHVSTRFAETIPPFAASVDYPVTEAYDGLEFEV